MPDSRQHRGPHPKDKQLFAPAELPRLRTATYELSWLLTRGYGGRSAMKLVGDRHSLRRRQQLAVRCSACADQAVEVRQQHQRGQDALMGRVVAVDGFNCLITIEAALAGGLVLVGRDRSARDLASVHGSYRKVAETQKAIDAVGAILEPLAAKEVIWFFDRPVSNSGRLCQFVDQAARDHNWPWRTELVFNPDRELLKQGDWIVASSDGWILDRCTEWVDLPTFVVRANVSDAWAVDLWPSDLSV